MTPSNTTARVHYKGKPAGEMPDNVRAALQLNFQRATANDIQGARSFIDAALEADQIPDADLPSVLAWQSESASELRMKLNNENNLKIRAASAPALVRSVGDSAGSLADNFSLSRAILTVAEGRSLQGAEAEAYQEAKTQMPQAQGQILAPDFVAKRLNQRNVYGNDSNQSGIDASVTGLQTLANPTAIALHKQPLAEQLGAQVIDATGANVYKLPYLGRTDFTNLNEGQDATSSASFLETDLSPKRYSRKATVSMLSLRTTAGALDQILANDFQAAAAAIQDKVAFDAVRNGTTYTVASDSGTDAGLAATTLADLFDLVTDFMNATGRNEYPDLLASPVAQAVLNTTVATNTDQTLAQVYTSQTGRRIIPVTNMADADFTLDDIVGGTTGNSVAGAGLVVAGNMNSLVIARWAGLDILLDRFGSNADANLISIHGNLWVNAGLIQDGFRGLAVAAADITAS